MMKHNEELLDALEKAILEIGMPKPQIHMPYGRFLQTKSMFGQVLSKKEKDYLMLYEQAQDSLKKWPSEMMIHIVIDEALKSYSFYYDGVNYSEDEMERIMKQKSFL